MDFTTFTNLPVDQKLEALRRLLLGEIQFTKGFDLNDIINGV